MPGSTTDDAVAVADEAHRARDVRHADVALDEDVDAGGSRQFGHAADASGRLAQPAPGPDEAALVGQDDRVHAVAQLQLGEDAGDVGLAPWAR